MSEASARDAGWMRAALGLARRGLGRVWPNPAVGCVIVAGNAVVGRGFRGDDPLSGSIPDGAFGKPMARADVLKAVEPFLVS